MIIFSIQIEIHFFLTDNFINKYRKLAFSIAAQLFKERIKILALLTTSTILR